MRKRLIPAKTTLAASLALSIIAAGPVTTIPADETPEGSAAVSMETFSYEPYAHVLRTYVNDKGLVEYGALRKNRAELDGFNRALGDLQRSDYDPWPREAKIAFWINAYNSLTLEAIINNYPIRVSFFNPKRLVYPENSIRQIGGVWDETTHNVLGERMTLDHIEHEILRKTFHEPRIHMALVCAAMGCPPLRNEPYTGDKLDAQLDDQAKKFLGNPKKFKIDRDAGTVYLSPIFKWFGEDFVEKYEPDAGYRGHSETERPVLNFAAGYLDEKDARYLEEEKYGIKYLDYDWSLNEQP